MLSLCPCASSRCAVQSCLSSSSSFLGAAAAKDLARRDMSMASLARLKALQNSLERDTAEAVKTQHNLYVLEYQRMHDRLGRNMDGSRKSTTVAMQVSDIISESTAATATAAGASAVDAANDGAAEAAVSGDAAPAETPAAGDASASTVAE